MCKATNPRPGCLSARPAIFARWLTLALQALTTSGGGTYRSRRLSEEAISHAAAKAFHIWTDRPDYFSSEAHLRNWLRQTAYWATVDEYRQARRWPLPLGNGCDGPDPRSLPRPAPRWTAEDRQIVWTCLQQLPDVERAILVGYYYEGLGDCEVAGRLFARQTASAALGLRVWRLRRKALAHLRQLLQQQGF
jgi:DNA-directed RNA polymerase specialized sigma24 family protein